MSKLNSWKEPAIALATLVSIPLSIYAMYWVAKHGSYAFFYEGMVKDTIIEMVKESSLIGGN